MVVDKILNEQGRKQKQRREKEEDMLNGRNSYKHRKLPE